MAAPKRAVTLAEQQRARVILAYLAKNYSRAIHADDPYLIEAITAWLSVSTGGGNNPFGLTGGHNDRPLVFKTLAQGLEAGARMLMSGGVYTTGALNALKAGGNEGAWQFLSWLEASDVSGDQFGAKVPGDGTSRLLKAYLSFSGLALPKQAAPPPKPVAVPAQADAYSGPQAPSRRQYLDPWEARGFYRARHPADTQG